MATSAPQAPESSLPTLLEFDRLFRKIEKECDIDLFDDLIRAYNAVMDDERVSIGDRFRVHWQRIYILGSEGFSGMVSFFAAKEPFKGKKKAELFSHVDKILTANVTLEKKFSPYAKAVAICAALLSDPAVDSSESKRVIDMLEKIQERMHKVYLDFSQTPEGVAALDKFNSIYMRFVDKLDFVAIDELPAAFDVLVKLRDKKDLPETSFLDAEAKLNKINHLGEANVKALVNHPKNPWKDATKEELLKLLQQETKELGISGAPLSRLFKSYVILMMVMDHPLLSPPEKMMLLPTSMKIMWSLEKLLAHTKGSKPSLTNTMGSA